MAFGFDPSIILGAKFQDPNETMRTLAQIGQAQDSHQLHQATLADMLRKQGQEQRLADVYRQYASNPEGLPTGLMGIGAAPQAADAQRFIQEKVQSEQKRVADAFYGVKDQSSWDAARAGLPEHFRSVIPEKFDPAAAQRLAALGVQADRRPGFEEQQRRAAALADPTSTTSQLRTSVAQQFGAKLQPGTAGNAIDDNELGLLERAQVSKEMAHLRYGSGAISGYSPEAIDTMAMQVLQSGHVPQFGPGATGAALRQAVFNRVSELAGGSTPGQRGGQTPRVVPDLATAQAGFEANKASLAEGQKVADVTDVNEGKALADMQVVRNQMKGVFNSSSPFLNMVGRKLQENSGNPEVAAFLTARQALVAQVNKVLNAGNLTESGRREAEDLLKSDASIAQINSVMAVLEQDMARSREATHKRVSDTRARIAGGTAGPGRAGVSSVDLGAETDHATAADWLRDPANKGNPNYARALSAYKKANGGAEP